MKVVVAVHLGSLFVSGAAEVHDCMLSEVIEGVFEDISQADGLVVIDGIMSPAIPSDFTRLIAEKLDEAAGEQEVAARIWGCDDGGTPYPAWQGRDGGFSLRHPCQAEAARAAVPFLLAADEVLVTGAWATRDGSSGCVSDVAAALRAELPARIAVRVSENCLFEEYRDEYSAWPDEEDGPEGPAP